MKRILPILLTFVATSALASPIPDFPFIAVSGEALAEVAPDKAEITFSVLVHSEDPEAATREVNQTLRKLAEGIIALKVPKRALTADDLGKRAVRERGENYQKLKILGYDVSRDVKVAIDDLERYTDVIRLIMKTTNITSVSSSFDIAKRDAVEAELIGKACADANRKALLMSKGVGSELGSVFAVSDRDFTSINERFGFGYSGGGAGEFSDDVPIFVPAKIDINASVEVLYRLGSAHNREQDAGGRGD